MVKGLAVGACCGGLKGLVAGLGEMLQTVGEILPVQCEVICVGT